MSSSRHRAARPALRSRALRLAVPTALAAVVTGLVVTVGLAAANGKDRPATDIAAGSAAMRVTLDDVSERKKTVSRTAQRVALDPVPVAKKWATAELNVWSKATDKSRLVGTIDDGDRVQVTGQRLGEWAEVLVNGNARYVRAEYLADEKPEDVASTDGISLAPCPDGTSIESGLTAGAVKLYRAACAAFPALSSYGGWDNHGEHASGKAIDFMVPPALGNALADWLRAHAAELDLYDVIWAQRIYTQERGGEGWRAMSNRGSATANHYDHVHASVY